MNAAPRCGLVLYTHGDIGAALLREATAIVGRDPQAVRAVAAGDDHDGLDEAIRAVDLGHGVLVLTDLQGASPANRAQRADPGTGAQRVVAGVNLPMLLRVLNYRAEPLDALARIAVEGGMRGVTALD